MFGFSLFQLVHSYLLFFCFVVVFICSSFVECRSTVPVKRVLPPKPGYIPVYIQHGDAPPDVASLYKSSIPLHKNMGKQKYKNNIYSGHYMSLNRAKQPNHAKTDSKHPQGVLYHKAAARSPMESHYKAKTKMTGNSRVKRFFDFWNFE
ncbi:hypothetical protein M8J76_008730 [Diaphorina citri]|nr:hypothetical protein M8J75_014390 [Diaphorina citri]KAI5749608.1 hypothetical protein M8J76_008730 [Diaphorina citri]